jgi:3-hydroxyisobutyrate dehydrogenase
MAARLIRAGYDVSIWNRTRAKAETEELRGAAVVESRTKLAGVDVLFTMVNTGKDLKEVCFGPEGMFRGGLKEMPKLLIDCSTIGMDESAEVRAGLDMLGVKFLASPVSGNPKCVRAGKFSCVVSGPMDAFESAKPLLPRLRHAALPMPARASSRACARSPSTSCWLWSMPTWPKSLCLPRRRA